MADLLELAERCEAATGPDRSLDTLIENALGIAKFERVPRSGFGGAEYERVTPKPYTASLDAALTLVPVGWDGALYLAADTIKPTVQLETPEMRARFSMDYEGVTGTAGTLALALCAAALRAREQS